MMRVFYFRNSKTCTLPVALKYYVIKLRTASHTFGNNVKITPFPV